MSLHSKNIAVLISGGGTNLQSIIDNKAKINGDIKIVISNKKSAYGLKRAENANIKTRYIVDNDELLKVLIDENIDLVVLAGYLKILPENIIDKFNNKIINIHPSLIPSFCGDGFYGLKVHEAAIKKGVKYSGATTHFVNNLTDDGPIINQDIVKVEENDTAESLQKKILEKEHSLLVNSIIDFCEDRLYVKDNRVFKRC